MRHVASLVPSLAGCSRTCRPRYRLARAGTDAWQYATWPTRSSKLEATCERLRRRRPRQDAQFDRAQGVRLERLEPRPRGDRESPFELDADESAGAGCSAGWRVAERAEEEVVAGKYAGGDVESGR